MTLVSHPNAPACTGPVTPRWPAALLLLLVLVGSLWSAAHRVMSDPVPAPLAHGPSPFSVRCASIWTPWPAGAARNLPGNRTAQSTFAEAQSHNFAAPVSGTTVLGHLAISSGTWDIPAVNHVRVTTTGPSPSTALASLFQLNDGANELGVAEQSLAVQLSAADSGTVAAGYGYGIDGTEYRYHLVWQRRALSGGFGEQEGRFLMQPVVVNLGTATILLWGMIVLKDANIYFRVPDALIDRHLRRSQCRTWGRYNLLVSVTAINTRQFHRVMASCLRLTADDHR